MKWRRKPKKGFLKRQIYVGCVPLGPELSHCQDSLPLRKTLSQVTKVTYTRYRKCLLALANYFIRSHDQPIGIFPFDRKKFVLLFAWASCYFLLLHRCLGTFGTVSSLYICEAVSQCSQLRRKWPPFSHSKTYFSLLWALPQVREKALNLCTSQEE